MMFRQDYGGHTGKDEDEVKLPLVTSLVKWSTVGRDGLKGGNLLLATVVTLPGNVVIIRY